MSNPIFYLQLGHVYRPSTYHLVSNCALEMSRNWKLKISSYTLSISFLLLFKLPFLTLQSLDKFTQNSRSKLLSLQTQ